MASGLWSSCLWTIEMETDFPCGAPRIRDLTRERQRKQRCSGEPQTIRATLRVLTERFEAMLAEIATHSPGI